jgi:hypothetical protein
MPEVASETPNSPKVQPTPQKRGDGNPRGKEAQRRGGSNPEIRLSQFTPNPRNPRKITDEQLAALKKAMAEFGDLSGLVVNLTTGHMVGGHQRLKILGDAPVEVTRRFPKPTTRGTCAEGFVTYKGERFIYREVRWNEDTEKAAMIAANKHGGDWDLPGLSEILMELDAEGFELPLTGFSAKELEQMLTKMTPDTDEQNIPAASDDVLPAHIRMVQLFLTVETLPRFMEQVQALGKVYEITNVTDTVVKAVAECYDTRNANADMVLNDNGHAA